MTIAFRFFRFALVFAAMSVGSGQLAAAVFTARENSVTGTVSDGSPTVLITVQGDDALAGCQREYLAAVTYSTSPPAPGATGTFTQPVRYYPGKNTIRARSSSGEETRTTTFTVTPPTLVVIMTWDGKDRDYDLYVNEVNWTNTTAGGGKLDIDSFASRNPESNDPGKEEISFQGAKPGIYRIYVNYYSDHDNGGSSNITVKARLGNEVIFTRTKMLRDHEALGASLAGTGKSVWNVGTVVVHGDKAGAYGVVDDTWATASTGWRDLFMGEGNKPLVRFNNQEAVVPWTDHSLTSLTGPGGAGPLVIGKDTSAQLTAMGQVNVGSSNVEPRALIGKFKSSNTAVAIVDDLGVVTGVGVGTAKISFGDYGSTELEVRVVDLSVVVDRSGDHAMAVANNETNHLKPFRFWLNDDHDIADASNIDPIYGDMKEQSDKEDSFKDSSDGRIMCRRDLEDFAPLKLQLNQAALLSTVQDAVVELRWGTATSGAPSIQLFRNVDDEGKLGYMGDFRGISLKQTAESGGVSRHYTALGVIAGGGWTSIGTIAGLKPVANGSGSEQILPLIFEAVSAGTGWLEVRVRATTGATLGIKRVFLHLTPLTEWYAHYSTDPSENADVDYEKGRGAIPGSVVKVRTAAEWLLKGTDIKPHTVISVHGFNMKKWDKKMFAESAYKRMWWNGFRGRYVQFDWPTTFSPTSEEGDPWYGPSSPSYNGFGRSEYCSFIAGDRLAGLLSTLKAEFPSGESLHVIAHSHGNIAAVNALRQVPARTVATYVALQAAVRSELYGAAAGVMSTPMWVKGLAIQDPEPTGPLKIDPTFTWDGSWWALWLDYPFADWLAVGPGIGLTTPNLAQGFLASGLVGANKSVNFFNPNDWALGEYIWEWSGLNCPTLRMAASNTKDQSYCYQRQQTVTNPPRKTGPFGAPDYDTNPGQRIGLLDFYSIDTVERVTVNQEIIVKRRDITPLPWTNGNAGFLFDDDAWVTPGSGEWRKRRRDERGGSDGGLHEAYDAHRVLPIAQANETLRRYEIISSVIETRMRAQGRSLLLNFTSNINIRDALWKGYSDDSLDPSFSDTRNGIDANDRSFHHHRHHSGEYNGTIVEQSVFWRRVVNEIGAATGSGVTIKVFTP